MCRQRKTVEPLPVPPVLTSTELDQPVVKRLVGFVSFLVVEVPTRVPVKRFADDRDDSLVLGGVFDAVVLTYHLVTHLVCQHVAQ